jgi:ribosome recycling factor
MKDMTFTEGAMAPFEKATEEEMNKSIKHFEHELVSIRSGRAHPSLVEGIKVSCYGGDTELPLKNLASISVPESRSLLIQPWDQSTLADIERAIKESDAGLTPANDGNIIRLQLPEMSSERREELIKVLGKKLEECRISIRNVRKVVQNLVRDNQKDKTISEDFAKRLNERLQKITDDFVKKAEALGSKKEAELKF